MNIPACKNCIYYKPRTFDADFTSTLNTCEKFGNKNIITDKITYDYADLCRQQHDKCGEDGKYFKEEPYIQSKILKHALVANIQFVLLLPIVIFSRVFAVVGK